MTLGISKQLRIATTTFQWQDMLRGDLMLMLLANHRYLLAKACAPPTA